MITCELKPCGLGSQLFQIATTLALAWDNNDTCAFNFNLQLEPSQGKRAIHYKNSVYRRLRVNNGVVLENVYHEPRFGYDKIPYSPNLVLDGYFLSEKYFKHHRDRIIHTLNIDTSNHIFFKYRGLLESEICAIYIRKGDYIRLDDYHPVLPLEYYRKAIELMKSKQPDIKFVVFSDNPQLAKDMLGSLSNENEFIERNDEVSDMYLMSLCNHQIIANSTFSWWSSWLNWNPNKIVIAPSQWLGKQCRNIDFSDIYTDEMIKIC